AEHGVGGLAVHPVVSGAGGVLAAGANEGRLLGAGDVVGVAAVEVAVGQLLRVELDEDGFGDALVEERLAFGGGAVAPVDPGGHGLLGDLVDPLADVRIVGLV